MICNKDTAKKTAKLLLEINAIKLQPKEPFTWASGLKSPIYCDNRITLSYPKVRQFIKATFVDEIKNKYPQVEVIAGVATGAIAIGALVADALDIPFVYVRPQPKAHGRKNQIEGFLNPNQKVLIIEDLISTGMSSMNAVKALQKSHAQILGMYAIFTYNFRQAETIFKEAAVTLYTLSDYDSLLAQSYESGFISDEDRTLLKKWKEDPSKWS
jgi:orotate phosphoribosyltransferase